jgi:uncharacterized repeat protein (TIGR01451 family)/MYXO-CTERM domain-containing protein
MRSEKTFSVLGAVMLGLVARTADAAPTLRVQVDQRGDFTLIGNTLAHDCASSTPAPVVGTVGQCGLLTSDSAPDVFWRSDDPSAGQASANVSIIDARSTAMLALPAGATVTHAYLYWAAAVVTDTSDASVVLERPGVFTESVAAIAAARSPINNHFAYQSVANVTALVKQHGAGAYRVAGVEARNPIALDNHTTFAGWWMAVFYELSTDPPRNLALFDGLDLVEKGVPAEATLAGFLVPNAGFDGKLGVVAYDGDDVFGGDQLMFNGGVLSNGVNPTNNFFNGTRSYLGSAVSVAGDLPQLTGGAASMSGIDLDVVDITARLQAGQTSAPIKATGVEQPDGNSDDFLLGGFVTSISTFAPEFSTSTKTVKDLNGGKVRPGDTLEYTINVKNTGNDASKNTVLVDVLPSGVTFVPGSIAITSGANSGTKTDASGDDQGEYIASTRSVKVRLGTGANASMGGSMAIGGSAVVTIRVTIDANTKGTIANQATITAEGEKGSAENSTVTDGNGTGPGKPPTSVEVDSGCETDSDCGDAKSGRVCDDKERVCIDGCRGKGGNGCPTDQVCSSTTEEIGTCGRNKADAGPTNAGDGGNGDGDAGITDDIVASGSGLSCSTRSTGGAGSALALLTLGVMAVFGASRRRHPKA